MKKLTYSKTGDDYSTKDPIKKIALYSASKTSKNLSLNKFNELKISRGESAFIYRNNNITLATVIEGLGTKNLIADNMYKLTGKTYYDVVGHDTVATIINDLVTVGASPLVIHAYWAIQNNQWLKDSKRFNDLVKGWTSACNIAGATWGGGETPTLNSIIVKDTIDLAGSATGIIVNEKNILSEDKLESEDRIILLKSNGINANGVSLARAISKNLDKGYLTKIGKKTFGELLLTRTNIYASLINDLLNNNVEVHYITNITGHGLQKIMRAKKSFTYTIEQVYKKSELFKFMQEKARISDLEAYSTWNMGQDYAIFINKNHVKKAIKIIKKNKFTGIDAGYIKSGKKEVNIQPLKIKYSSAHMNLK